MSTNHPVTTAGESADEYRRRCLSLRYRSTHTRGACRVRWEAYDLAMLYLSTDRAHLVTPGRIHAQINGGRCAFAPVRSAIADARHDWTPAAAERGTHA